MATLEKSTKVYLCCGQYFATTKACADTKVKCPRCGKYLTNKVILPNIVIIKK